MPFFCNSSLYSFIHGGYQKPLESSYLSRITIASEMIPIIPAIIIIIPSSITKCIQGLSHFTPLPLSLFLVFKKNAALPS